MKTTTGMRRLSTIQTKWKLVALILVLASGFFIISPKVFRMPKAVERAASSTESEKQVSGSSLTQSSKPDSIERTAKIITCPRCRLNSLPKVKKFVLEHAKHFAPALKVDFILGEDPVLHLYENKKEVREVELEDYNEADIVRMLVKFGIKPVTENEVIREALKTAPKGTI